MIAGRPAHTTILYVALLMAIAYLSYANTFGNSWTYDDFPVIVENPDVRSWIGFLSNSYPSRPLRELTFLLDHSLFGLKPAGWHIQAIFWHGVCGTLVYFLGLRIGLTRICSWVAALLFLVHPVQVEAIANLSHRKESLALAFSLAALLAYSQSVHGEPKSRLRWFFCAFGFGVLAFGGKENALAIPLVFIGYELAFAAPAQRWLLRFPKVLIGSLAGGVVAGSAWLYWVGQAHYLDSIRAVLQYKANYLGQPGLLVYAGMVLKSWAFMVLRFFWPASLAVEYTYPVPSSWLDPWVLGALSGAAAFCFFLGLFLKRSPRLFFAMIWFGAFWLPVSNLWPLSYFAADRYLYAPSVGLVLMVALGLERLVADQRAQLALALIVGGGLAVLTWQQSKVWRSPETLWTQAYKVSPQSSFALNNLGNIHVMRGEKLSALEYYRMAAKINPLNPTAQYNLGWMLEELGLKDQALGHYRNFLELNDPMFEAQAETLRRRLMQQYPGRF